MCLLVGSASCVSFLLAICENFFHICAGALILFLLFLSWKERTLYLMGRIMMGFYGMPYARFRWPLNSFEMVSWYSIKRIRDGKITLRPMILICKRDVFSRYLNSLFDLLAL